MTNKFILVVAGLMLAAGAGFPARADLPQVAASGSSRDIKIPLPLVQRIEKQYHDFLIHEGAPKDQSVLRRLLSVSIDLTQDHAAALQQNMEVVTPQGGGIVDLSQFVTPVPGDFRVQFVVRADSGEKLGDVRAYFISHARTRVINGETFGAGCDKYMDITSYFNKTLLGSGLQVFTAGQRYASVLGGTFVVTAFTKEALYVGSLQFKDSRYPEYFCE